MLNLALLLCGFSIISALVLALSHFHKSNYPDQPSCQWFGIVLVVSLAAIQLIQFLYLQSGIILIESDYYHALLFMVAPSFYLFSRPLLTGVDTFSPAHLIHFAPVLLAFLLPSSLSLTLAFAIGSVYLIWLIHHLYRLRFQRSRFKLEVSVLVIALLLGIAVLVMGFSLPLIDGLTFYSLYSIAIGLAFILVNLAINLTPKLPSKITQAAVDTYASSTLNNIDCDAQLQRLEQLMTQDKAYEDPKLDLATLADRLGLSSHQCSELINSRLGKGFSRYIREQRVQAAQVMLLDEPSASVLSVGLHVGFTSQSNFYEAFREITDMTPGKYRKISASSAPK